MPTIKAPYFLLAGALLGALIAWSIQSLRIDALQSQYDAFVDTAKAAGDIAQKQADARAEHDKQLKATSDANYQTAIDNLNADIARLRNARAGRNIVPPSPTNSRRPDLACFDRAELEQAVRNFDSGIQRLVDQGSANTIRLNAAAEWGRKL